MPWEGYRTCKQHHWRSKFPAGSTIGVPFNHSARLSWFQTAHPQAAWRELPARAPGCCTSCTATPPGPGSWYSTAQTHIPLLCPSRFESPGGQGATAPHSPLGGPGAPTTSPSQCRWLPWQPGAADLRCVVRSPWVMIWPHFLQGCQCPRIPGSLGIGRNWEPSRSLGSRGCHPLGGEIAAPSALLSPIPHFCLLSEEGWASPSSHDFLLHCSVLCSVSVGMCP